jgi:hypothetical protein
MPEILYTRESRFKINKWTEGVEDDRIIDRETRNLQCKKFFAEILSQKTIIGRTAPRFPVKEKMAVPTHLPGHRKCRKPLIVPMVSVRKASDRGPMVT